MNSQDITHATSNDTITAALVRTAEQVIRETANKRSTRLDALRVKQKQLTEQIRQLETQASTKQRKEETRRLILIGRCVAEWAKRDWAFSADLRAELERFATRDRDRSLLGLTVLRREARDNVGGR